MPATVRVVVPTDSQDAASWAQALAYAEAIGEGARPPVETYVLLTHAKQQLGSTSLASHVGGAAAKALLAGEGVPMRRGGRLCHATLRTMRNVGSGAVIVAYFADDALMDAVDGLGGVVGIVAVPDMPGQVDGWTARWNPFVHGREAAEAPPLVTDPVVEGALASLSDWVNLSHGVMNPRDKAHADETLRILRAKGHVLEAEKIRSWAIRNGWKPGAAGELAKLAERIGSMKTRPSLASFHNPEGKYEGWAKRPA